MFATIKIARRGWDRHEAPQNLLAIEWCGVELQSIPAERGTRVHANYEKFRNSAERGGKLAFPRIGKFLVCHIEFLCGFLTSPKANFSTSQFLFGGSRLYTLYWCKCRNKYMYLFCWFLRQNKAIRYDRRLLSAKLGYVFGYSVLPTEVR